MTPALRAGGRVEAEDGAAIGRQHQGARKQDRCGARFALHPAELPALLAGRQIQRVHGAGRADDVYDTVGDQRLGPQPVIGRELPALSAVGATVERDQSTVERREEQEIAREGGVARGGSRERPVPSNLAGGCIQGTDVLGEVCHVQRPRVQGGRAPDALGGAEQHGRAEFARRGVDGAHGPGVGRDEEPLAIEGRGGDDMSTDVDRLWPTIGALAGLHVDGDDFAGVGGNDDPVSAAHVRHDGSGVEAEVCLTLALGATEERPAGLFRFLGERPGD